MASVTRIDRIVHIAVLLLSMTLAGTGVADEAALAAAAEGTTRWACWYSPADLTIRCRLAEAAANGATEHTATAADSRLPELVRTIWDHPEHLADRTLSIPLWTPPTEMDFAGTLAQSVMCGVQTACAVNFDANHDGRATQRVAMRLAGESEEGIAAAQGLVAPMALADEPKPTSWRRPSRRANS